MVSRAREVTSSAAAGNPAIAAREDACACTRAADTHCEPVLEPKGPEPTAPEPTVFRASPSLPEITVSLYALVRKRCHGLCWWLCSSIVHGVLDATNGDVVGIRCPVTLTAFRCVDGRQLGHGPSRCGQDIYGGLEDV